MNSNGSWWHVKRYTMRFIMLQRAIPRPLIETQRLYETGHNLRQYGILISKIQELQMLHNVHIIIINSVMMQ